MNCKDVNEYLSAYLDGEVTPAERKQIQTHLAICPQCREELEELIVIREDLSGVLKAMADRVASSGQAWVTLREQLQEKHHGLNPLDWATAKLRTAADSARRRLVPRQLGWKVTIVIAACLVVLGSLGAWLLFGQPAEVTAKALVQQAQISREALANQLSPGKVLHMKTESYRRHGPAASRIEDEPWALPETYYTDVWMKVDTEGNFYCYQGITTDTMGNVVQESKTVDGEQVYIDVASGEERWTPWEPWSVTRFLQGTGDAVERLVDRGWQLVGKGEWDGKETAVFERRSTWVSQWTDLTSGYVIPWTADLNPAETIFRLEVVTDNPRFHNEQTWVVNSSGQQTLVQERKVVAIEVLDEQLPLGPCPPAPSVKEFTLADAPAVLDLSSLLSVRFKHVDATGTGLSNKDLGLGPTWSEVELFRSDKPSELIYAYLTIIDRGMNEQARLMVMKGLRAGVPGEYEPPIIGTDITEMAIFEAIRDVKGGGTYGVSSDEGWELTILRVDRVLVAVYSISQSADKQPLHPLVELVQRRIGSFSQ